MNMRTIKASMLAAVCALAVSAVSAQENIIIRKKKDSKEKITVVVDGDNITVNGKPLSEYKGGDLEVIRREGSDLRELRALTLPRIATAPRATVRGGVQGLFDGDHFTMAYGTNSAMLGVNTEKDDKGAKVTSVTKESAAEKAGLKKDDVITKVGDKKIEDSDDLYEAIGKYKPEEKVSITYLRDGKEATATATLTKNRTTVWSQSFDAPRFELDNFSGTYFPSIRPRIGMQIQDTEDNSGVKVLSVGDESLAEKAGLKENDVIIEANGKAVKDLDDIRDQLKDLKEGDSVKIRYKRGSSTENTEIKFPKRLQKANF